MTGITASEAGGSRRRRAAMASSRRRRRFGLRVPISVRVWQVAIVAGFLLAWQYIPTIPGIAEQFTFADPFFISSPSEIATAVVDLATGNARGGSIWPAFLDTFVPALCAVLAAIVVGALGGLVLSESPYLARVVRPYLVLLNAVPRIAVIPIIILIASSSTLAVALSAFGVSVFLVFFNAFEGGRTIPRETLQSVEIFGASRLRIMMEVRLPYVLVWTFATLPNAIAFGVIGAVTAELFAGSSGIGGLLIVAVGTANATLLFAAVTFLTAANVLLVLGAELLQRRVLHWWEQGTVA